MLVVPGQVSIVGRRGAEDHVGTQVVLALLAVIAVATGHTRFDGNTVAHLQVGHILAQLGHQSSGFVANDHRLGQHKVPDAPVSQIVNVRAADSHTIHRQEYL
ncbi:hypothetical protein M5D96_002123 [Drosophila gunungcola]|uniref:Uncharacterized protein n=1 Tax=Drosophila gunungcola TaxID=103775 RepID=A0A9Q0BV74_9MUSC|nr:hypothetical protein M5D96_002123 [Drosophila gunungcola]